MTARRIILLAAWLGISLPAAAQTVYSVTTYADAFVAIGSANNPDGTNLTDSNFGGAGALVVAPANSAKGEFQTLLKFNLAGATNLFNATYGSNQWTVTGITLTLTGNFATQGAQPNNAIFPAINTGKFTLAWLSDDSWLEGTGNPNLPTTDGVTYSSLPGLLSSPHDTLGTYTYTPPGNNIPITYPLPLDTNLVQDITAGGDVSFLLYAADDQIGYLFNSYFYGRGNQPLLNITASPPPLKILSASFTNTAFHLTGQGLANTSYQIQAAPQLPTTNWQTLATITANATGQIQFTDATTPPSLQRFYRLAQSAQ